MQTYPLEHKLYYCTLALRKADGTISYTNRLSRDDIHALPRDNLFYGNINGHLISQLPFADSVRTVGQLDDVLDQWLTRDDLLPDLYLVGGYYPRPDRSWVFDIQKPSAKDVIYLYGREPCTDLPVYRVEQDTLRRVKDGSIPSPKSVTIDAELHQKIVRSLTAYGLLWL